METELNSLIKANLKLYFGRGFANIRFKERLGIGTEGVKIKLPIESAQQIFFMHTVPDEIQRVIRLLTSA